MKGAYDVHLVETLPDGVGDGFEIIEGNELRTEPAGRQAKPFAASRIFFSQRGH